MIKAFVKAVQQLGDPSIRKYILMSLFSAILTFIVLWSAVGYLLTETAVSDIGWVESTVDVLGGLATLVLTWFLFPATVSAVISLFLDQVADCVEKRHYPGLEKTDGAPVGEQVVLTIKFLAILIGLNILLLPFLFLGPIFPFVFYGVNGYLLGREYFEMVAARRMPGEAVTRLRKARQGRLLLVGAGIAFLLTIPIVNLLMPVVATATMVHLFETWRNDPATLPSKTST